MTWIRTRRIRHSCPLACETLLPRSNYSSFLTPHSSLSPLQVSPLLVHFIELRSPTILYSQLLQHHLPPPRLLAPPVSPRSTSRLSYCTPQTFNQPPRYPAKSLELSTSTRRIIPRCLHSTTDYETCKYVCRNRSARAWLPPYVA